MTRYAQGLPLTLERWDYEKVRRRFDAATIAGESKFVMVSVVFDLSKMLSSNVVVQKHLYRVEQASMDLTEWMDDAAPLRVLFVGSARRDYGLGLVWRFFDEDAVLRDPAREMPMKDACCGLLGREVHRDPHDCSAACMSLQLDGCSMICNGWYESHKEAYNGIMYLDDANAMTPPYDNALLGLGLVHLLGIKNCEFVFKLRSPIKAGVAVQKQLEELVSKLITFFNNIGAGPSCELAAERTSASLCLSTLARGTRRCPTWRAWSSRTPPTTRLQCTRASIPGRARCWTRSRPTAVCG